MTVTVLLSALVGMLLGGGGVYLYLFRRRKVYRDEEFPISPLEYSDEYIHAFKEACHGRQVQP